MVPLKISGLKLIHFIVQTKLVLFANSLYLQIVTLLDSVTAYLLLYCAILSNVSYLLDCPHTGNDI